MFPSFWVRVEISSQYWSWAVAGGQLLTMWTRGLEASDSPCSVWVRMVTFHGVCFKQRTRIELITAGKVYPVNFHRRFQAVYDDEECVEHSSVRRWVKRITDEEVTSGKGRFEWQPWSRQTTPTSDTQAEMYQGCGRLLKSNGLKDNLLYVLLLFYSIMSIHWCFLFYFGVVFYCGVYFFIAMEVTLSSTPYIN